VIVDSSALVAIVVGEPDAESLLERLTTGPAPARVSAPAGLNLGDCFAYAAARAFGEPLLFKGDDFAQTDVPAA
jgi:uncharacterized protein with PIN domain